MERTLKIHVHHMPKLTHLLRAHFFCDLNFIAFLSKVYNYKIKYRNMSVWSNTRTNRTIYTIHTLKSRVRYVIESCGKFPLLPWVVYRVYTVHRMFEKREQNRYDREILMDLLLALALVAFSNYNLRRIFMRNSFSTREKGKKCSKKL